MIPTSKQAYISAESDSSATVSGPPSTLLSLFSSSETFKKARRIKLPITAAFHAPHLRVPDVEKILGSLSHSDEYPLRNDAVIVSTRSGKPITAQSLGDALQHIIMDILREPLRWSRVVEEMTNNLKDQGATLTSAGPVRAADSLRQRMANAGIEVLKSTEMQPRREQHTKPRSSDIAIIGYAARLPESETLEEAWKLLEDGRDVHKKASFEISRGKLCSNFHRSLVIVLTWTLIVIRPVKLRIRVTLPMDASWTDRAFSTRGSLT